MQGGRRSRKHVSKKHRGGKKGGRKTQKHRKSKKGGSGMFGVGALVKQAIVPAFLFGAQKSVQNRRR
jgi:hypothetical protein